MTKLVNKILFINNRRTSMRLCLKEWDAVGDICKKENISRNNLVQLLENNNKSGLGLTYFTRLFMLTYFREASTDDGHKKASHGIPDSVKTLISRINPL